MKNQWHISQRHSSMLIQTFILKWSQLVTSSWQCQCQLLPPNDLLHDAQSEDVLMFHDENRATCPSACLRRHTHWCRSRDLRILHQTSLSSTKISDMCATNVSLVRSLRCCCCWPQPQLAVLVQYGILAFTNLFKRPDCTRLHVRVLKFSEFSRKAGPQTPLACRVSGSHHTCNMHGLQSKSETPDGFIYNL